MATQLHQKFHQLLPASMDCCESNDQRKATKNFKILTKDVSTLCGRADEVIEMLALIQGSHIGQKYWFL